MTIVIFARRKDADGNSQLVMLVEPQEEREIITSRLSKAGFEVYSGPVTTEEELNAILG